MRKILLVVALSLAFFNTMSANDDKETVVVDGKDYREYVTVEDGEVITYNYAYAYSDSSQEKSKKTKRERSVSTSKSTSTSTSNGKTVTSVAVSKSGGESEITIVDQLNVFPLFGDKYKRHPDCVLTVIENQNSKFRELKVNNNAGLVKEIRALVEKDAENSFNVVRTYNKDSDVVVMNGEYGSVGYTEYLDNASCSVFISWR